MLSNHPPVSATAADPSVVRRKVFWRIVPLLFLLYIVAYLDRANISYAKLEMERKLGFLSPEVYGWGVGLFFVGYLLLEIPGALLVEHWSARKWFARILITWGLCSMGMALVTTASQFYTMRFLLGLAEAGFFPGVIVYLTHWFPRADRGRAFAGLVLGVPFSQAIGAWISGAIIENVRWFDLAGWQWVFLLEGAPAVVLGVAVLFLLTDRPHQARWLTPSERDWLEETLAAERRQASAAGGAVTLGQALRLPAVWLLALGILVTNTGGYGLGFWLPTTVQGFLTQLRGTVTSSEVLAWTGIYFACGMVGVWVVGQSSDRTGERKWHCVAGQVLTGLFLAASAVPGQPWGVVFGWLCLTGFFAFFWPPPFWVLPTQALSASAAAVAIGFINICANVAGILGPPAVGWLKGHGFDDRTCLFFLAACYALGGVFVAALRLPAAPPPTPYAGDSPGDGPDISPTVGEDSTHVKKAPSYTETPDRW
jgi:ACS family tartrate transporter-like MFS transporter